jgi:transcriptional regulator with XRE-family HTH domain
MYTPHPFRRARQLLGLTQIECAQRARMCQSKLSLLERGYVLPSDDEARRLAEVVGGDPQELFSEVRKVADREHDNDAGGR